MLDSLAIMLAIVIPTIVALLVFAWWFRESNMRARYMPDFVYSGRIELVVWSIPILVILFLGGSIWIMERMNTNMMPMGRRSCSRKCRSASWDGGR